MTSRIVLAGLAAATLACGSSSGTPAGPNPTGDIQVGNNFFYPDDLPGRGRRYRDLVLESGGSGAQCDVRRWRPQLG